MDFKEITTYGNDVKHVSICKKLKCQLYPYIKSFYEYDGNIYTLELYERIGLSVDVLVKMLLFDALLESQDRHCGNWGICKKHGKRGVAPIFDNGAGLLSRAKFTETNVGTDINSDTRSWWERRMYEFPNSKIMFRKS